MRDHMDELVDLLGCCGATAYRVEQFQRRSRVQEPQMIPPFELTVEPIGHRQELIERTIRHAPSQLWGDEVPDERTVEGVPPNGNPICAEHLVGSRRAGISRGRNLQERQVTRASTTIRDEDHLCTFQLLPIGISSGYRFELKGDLVEATGMQSRPQALQCQGLIFWPLRTRKMHRAFYYHSGPKITKLRLGCGAEGTHDDGDEIFQSIQMGEHVRAFEQTTRQEGFDGLHEASFGIGAEIAANGLWTGHHMWIAIVVLLRVREVQHRPKCRGDLSVVLKGR